MTKINVVYVEDQSSMQIGIKSFFDETEFNIIFITNPLTDLAPAIIAHTPLIVISDDDIGGRNFADDIVRIVKQSDSGKKITLIGCSAYADARGIEKKYKSLGFDRFFDNDGTNECLDAILNYMRTI